MKRSAQCLVLILLAIAFVGCAAAGPSVIPNGVVRSTDAAGGGDPATYRIYTAYGQDKWGINTASTFMIKETPSLPGQPAKSEMVYGQTAANTGINKALTEQVIPAVGNIGQGAPAAWILRGAHYGGSSINVGDVNASGMTQGQGQQQKATNINKPVNVNKPTFVNKPVNNNDVF